MSSLNVNRVGNVEFVFPLKTPGQRNIGPYGHRAAVVLSRSGVLRKTLERALAARGAAAVNLRTLPPLTQIEDLLASGLILLAPPGDSPLYAAGNWIEASETDTVQALVAELEQRGVLLSREYISPGEGI